MLPRYFALIPAAGGGSRFGGEAPKQYAALADEPLLQYAVRALSQEASIARTYVVLAPDDRHYAQVVGEQERVSILQCGGATRAESVRNGLERMHGEARAQDWVLVHDAARPCLLSSDLRKLLFALADDPVGGLLAVRVADTLKRDDGAQRVADTPARDGLWQAQTPQMFRYGILFEALAQDDALGATDEAQAVERLGLKPKLIEGSRSNIKVTYAADLALAAAILAQRKERT